MFVLQKGTEAFQYVSERNRARQYDFLRTAFEISRSVAFPVDRQFLCDLNFYAVQYLCEQPGRYRTGCNVEVGSHIPPKWEDVEPAMAQFWNVLAQDYLTLSPLECAAFALWGVNHIHPFVEGNGRSSRALAYFILCNKLEFWLPGKLAITEQIRLHHRSEYCDILGRMDGKKLGSGRTDLTEMTAFLDRLLTEQLKTA